MPAIAYYLQPGNIRIPWPEDLSVSCPANEGELLQFIAEMQPCFRQLLSKVQVVEDGFKVNAGNNPTLIIEAFTRYLSSDSPRHNSPQFRTLVPRGDWPYPKLCLQRLVDFIRQDERKLVRILAALEVEEEYKKDAASRETEQLTEIYLDIRTEEVRADLTEPVSSPAPPSIVPPREGFFSANMLAFQRRWHPDFYQRLIEEGYVPGYPTAIQSRIDPELWEPAPEKVAAGQNPSPGKA